MGGIYPIIISKQAFYFSWIRQEKSGRLQTYFSDAWNFSVAHGRVLSEI